MSGAEEYYTLCIPHQYPYILLGRQKNGSGWGRWNGFINRVDLHNVPKNKKLLQLHFMISARQGLSKAMRNISPSKLELSGLIERHMAKNPTRFIYVYSASGVLYPGHCNDESQIAWVSHDCLPKDLGTESDSWLPMFLGGKKFIIGSYFDSLGSYMRDDYLFQLSAIKIQIPSIDS